MNFFKLGRTCMNNSENKQPVHSIRLMTRLQVAERLGVCPHTVARLVKLGKLSEIKINQRLIRYRLEEVLKLTSEI